MARMTRLEKHMKSPNISNDFLNNIFKAIPSKFFHQNTCRKSKCNVSYTHSYIKRVYEIWVAIDLQYMN